VAEKGRGAGQKAFFRKVRDEGMMERRAGIANRGGEVLRGATNAQGYKLRVFGGGGASTGSSREGSGRIE